MTPPGDGMPRASKILLGVVAVAVTVAAVVAMAWRLRFGVDFGDEAYYIGLAYRFVLGDRPFVDEMSLLQIASFLTYPLVKAYVALHGTYGIVLFMRVAWFAATLFLCAAGFAFLRMVMRWELALVACVLPLLVVPFNIPTLSYDSMGAGLLALGVALGAWHAVQRRGWGWLLAAGLVHGLAVVAYPTLGVAVVAFAAALLVLDGRRGLRGVAVYVGGAVAVLAVLAVALVRFGIPNVRHSLAYMMALSGYAGGASKIAVVAGRTLTFLALEPLFVAALVVAYAAFLAFGDRGRWALLLVPLGMYPVVTGLPALTGAARNMGAILMIGLFGVYLGLFTLGRPLARRVYVWAVLPSVVAAAVTAYTSTNGFVNAGIGFFPMLFATPALLALALHEPRPQGSLSALVLPWALMAVLAVTLLHAAQYEYRAIYRDGRLEFLTHQVTSGPYAGLWTLKDTAQASAELETTVKRYVLPGDRVMFFDDFPAGYLYTTARPAVNTLWLSRSDNRPGVAANYTLAYWRATGNVPDVVFRYLHREHYRHGHIVWRYVQPPRYLQVAHLGRFDVFRRAD